MLIILTTLYNAENYIENCLGSLMGQSVKEFKCFITDDISTDNSANIAENFIKDDNRFTLIRNQKKYYQPGNYDQIIRGDYGIEDNDIIIELDGDDSLPDVNVLKRINELYSDNNVWIANGSFRYTDGRAGFASKQNFNDIRNLNFTASHIRTWRAFLWRNIKIEDLKDESGDYWKVAGDLSFMFPMLEMSGEEHYRFMPEINYRYNEENPINDHKVNGQFIRPIFETIRLKKQYEKLIR
jgi:glycosyltransferase involved in cell wall biosynthesis